ncbi:MAG: hypothetical protein HQK52_16905 [Oligoflexia bacterium]|nr:hypothetical protein [Oligoflexia bacterium]
MVDFILNFMRLMILLGITGLIGDNDNHLDHEYDQNMDQSQETCLRQESDACVQFYNFALGIGDYETASLYQKSAMTVIIQNTDPANEEVEFTEAE